LLLVGSLDEQVLSWNRQAYDRLSGHRDLVVVPGASHLFEEPGKLAEMAHLAADWFRRFLR
jgi:putative phosphoribosyl transferase